MAISDADLEELSSMVMLLPRHACDKLRELVDLAARQLASVDELATLRAQRDELKKDRDMWRAECESLTSTTSRPC